jgi:hypothetical protein
MIDGNALWLMQTDATGCAIRAVPPESG